MAHTSSALLSRLGHTALATTLLAITACSVEKVSQPVHATALRLPGNESYARSRSDHRAGEAHLHYLAQHNPGFAGIRLIGANTLLVLDTASTPNVAFAGTVRAMLAQMRVANPGELRIQFERARFSFGSLVDWRDKIADHLYSLAGWGSLDLDEGKNKIVIGMRESSRIIDAIRLLTMLGVPEAAYEVTVEGGIVSNAVLESRLRPLRGGLMVTPAECTLGPVVLWGADTVALINSHCSSTRWAFDGGVPWLSQPNAARVGVEIWDTGGYVCGVLNRDRCRRADLSVFTPNVDLIPGEQGFVFGEIARPTLRRPGSDQATGGGWIVADNPLLITGTTESLIQGMVIDKVGWTTGWTFGQVTQTCYDAHVEDLPGFSGHRTLSARESATTTLTPAIVELRCSSTTAPQRASLG